MMDESKRSKQPQESDAITTIQEAAAIFLAAESCGRTTTTHQTSTKTAPIKAKRKIVPWKVRVQQLAAYKELHGNLNIPIRWKTNPSLGKFVHNTREKYKLFLRDGARSEKPRDHTLTLEKVQELQELGFVFNTERRRVEKDEWNARFDQLLKFKKDHGHLMIPHDYPPDKSFAEWVHRQRTAYTTMQKEASPSPLVKERMDRLKGIGFHFTVHSDKWTLQYNQLKEYKAIHGHCNVPVKYAENPRLGRWVNTQRSQNQYRIQGKKTNMTEERFNLLDDLRFSWTLKPALEHLKTWQERVEQITNLKNKHGHFKILTIQDESLNGEEQKRLNEWCLGQRYRLRLLDKNGGEDVTKRMGPERVRALHAIGFTKDTEIANFKSKLKF